MNSAVATLIVYAYASFASSFGAGPVIVKNFEKTCGCHVLLVNAGDAGEMLAKVKLEGQKSKADLLLGVDEAFLPRVKKDLKWDFKTGTTAKEFDYAPLAFVYNSEVVKTPPSSLDDLLKPQWKKQIIIEDPRLSTTGLNFLLWVINQKGEEGAWKYYEQLKGQVRTVTPAWDLAYGLFKKNQAKLVLSYWTSPAYHIQEEKKTQFKAAPFSAGHYVQSEYVVENPHSVNKKLAESFMSYLLSEEVQKVIMAKNFMYPVNGKVPLSEAFKEIGIAPKMAVPKVDQKKLEKNLEKWMNKWREIFS